MTQKNAANRALACALKEIARKFNAAELDSFVAAKYPGFHIARGTVQPRHIHQHTLLDIPDEKHAQFAAAR